MLPETFLAGFDLSFCDRGSFSVYDPCTRFWDALVPSTPRHWIFGLPPHVWGRALACFPSCCSPPPLPFRPVFLRRPSWSEPCLSALGKFLRALCSLLPWGLRRGFAPIASPCRLCWLAVFPGCWPAVEHLGCSFGARSRSAPALSSHRACSWACKLPFFQGSRLCLILSPTFLCTGLSDSSEVKKCKVSGLGSGCSGAEGFRIRGGGGCRIFAVMSQSSRCRG